MFGLMAHPLPVMECHGAGHAHGAGLDEFHDDIHRVGVNDGPLLQLCDALSDGVSRG